MPPRSGDGPRGADGTRPMLGGGTRAADSAAPRAAANQFTSASAATTRNQQGSAWGSATAATGDTSSAAARGRGCAAQFDEEGFLVARGGRANSLGYVRRAAMGAAGGAAPSWAERLRGDLGSAGGGTASAACNLAPPRPAAAAAGDGTSAETNLDANGEQQDGSTAPPGAARPAAKQTMEEDEVKDEEDDEMGELDEKGTQCKSPAELRRDWNEAINTVKYLERRGGPKVPQAVLDSARRARDEAEQAWRTSKPQHPLGKRLRWAAAELEAALEKQNAHRAELEEFEADVERRRAELVRRQEIDEARTARKKEALDQLREEAGPTAASAAVGRRAMAEIRRVRPTMWATRMALEGIQSEVGPVLEKYWMPYQRAPRPGWTFREP